MTQDEFDKTMEMVSNLTVGQASFFKQIYDSPERTCLAKNSSEGSFALSLLKLGLLRKNGRIGDKILWQACFERLALDHVAIINQVAKVTVV